MKIQRYLVTLAVVGVLGFSSHDLSAQVDWSGWSAFYNNFGFTLFDDYSPVDMFERDLDTMDREEDRRDMCEFLEYDQAQACSIPTDPACDAWQEHWDNLGC